jgi:hypothetical protein
MGQALAGVGTHSTRCNNMDEAFNNWLKTPKTDGGAGLAPGTPLDKTTYNMLMREYVKADSNFTPTTGMATNAVSQEVTPYFMSSPNSAQPMTERQPALKPVSGKDGKAYNYNPVTGTYAPALIEGTTNQFEMDPKSNALAEALAQMAGPQGAETAEPSAIASFFGFGGGAPAASPTPSPTPEPAPMATPMPAMAGTNAPVPALSTPEAVRAAFLAGQISEAQAVQMLRGGR